VLVHSSFLRKPLIFVMILKFYLLCSSSVGLSHVFHILKILSFNFWHFFFKLGNLQAPFENSNSIYTLYTPPSQDCILYEYKEFYIKLKFGDPQVWSSTIDTPNRGRTYHHWSKPMLCRYCN
jgi:hypothetical protein